MKSNPLTAILLGVLAVCAFASLVLCYLQITYTREFRHLQSQAAFISMRQSGINQLITDVVEYSQKNPAVTPILDSVGVKAKSAPAPAAAKPATR